MSESTARQPADADARRQALDPKHSFIVQAPAGSGKTELLIRRLLMLLAQVDAPEEVVALTFTRKAAGEMRSRVIEALARAANDAPPASAYERETWQLARAVLARDAQLGWSLDANAGRLRIQTLDGLCATLVRRMPLLSQLGGMPALQEDAEPLYREAAQAALALLDEGTAEQSDAVATVLLHFDNNAGVVENLLVSMLARRDQWIRRVMQHDATGDRALFEGALRTVRREAFARLRSMLRGNAAELVGLAAWAAGNLPDDSDAALLACRGLAALPTDDESDTPVWLGLADLLLTKSGSFRRKVDRRNGFPPPSDARDAAQKQRLKEAQQAFLALVESCEREPGLCEALAGLAALPPPGYDDAQWQVLAAVVQVLRLAAAQLQLVFAEQGACDFTAVAQGALAALGPPDVPSDLLLSLDARIRHLLVDEFQDTSFSQFELLERLTAGWSDGDGRTLFVVGDPMQSIYRFREAEVGLFLRARQRGIGALTLVPLRLSTNFRSAQGIVDWVNEAFVHVMPPVEDDLRGAVPFERATQWHPADAGPAVTVHAWANGDAAAEAQRVVEVVRQARADDAEASVAVLVRGRSHLAQIVPALREAGLPVRAVEIETLREQPVVLDLLALTRALRHPADRIAWLAVLRAPWCGLQLADLDALVADAPREPIWQLLQDPARRAALSDEGRARVELLVRALAPALDDARRATLHATVAGAWLRLGGADALRGARAASDAAAYLELLASVEQAGDIADLGELDARMDRLFAAPDPLAGAGAVELMTIHKAKGLEFDVVILPGLHRRPRISEAPLLAWIELPRRDGPADLVMGTVGARGAGRDAVHGWIGEVERSRERLEAGRLLYVAATRARHRLHLMGSATVMQRDGSFGLRTPVKDCLLYPLWPVVEPVFERALQDWRAPTTASAPETPQLDQRTWRLPLLPPVDATDPRLAAPPWQAPAAEAGERPPVEFSWAGETVRLVGTLVHRWLQRMADGVGSWDQGRIDTLSPQLEAELAALGVPESERAEALRRTLQALRTALADTRGRWVLQARPGAASELKLTGVDGDRLVNVAIDRSFVEDGVRWVIDYKTGLHEGAGIDAFLDREVERYRGQLERYARFMAQFGPEPVRCGLYFPLLGAWREWDSGARDSADRKAG